MKNNILIHSLLDIIYVPQLFNINFIREPILNNKWNFNEILVNEYIDILKQFFLEL